MQAYDFRKVAALLDGPTTIALRDAEPITIAHDRALASFQRVSAADQRLSIEVPALRIGEDASCHHRKFPFPRARREAFSTSRQAAKASPLPSRTRNLQSTRRRSKATCRLSAMADHGNPARPRGLRRQDQHHARFGEQGRTSLYPAKAHSRSRRKGFLDGRIRTVISDLGLFITELQGSLRLSEKEVAELRALGGVLAGATGGRSVARRSPLPERRYLLERVQDRERWSRCSNSWRGGGRNPAPPFPAPPR